MARAMTVAGEGPDPHVLLGAALPDLASMGHFRLLGETANLRVARGIAAHHRTDDLFHRHRWFSARNRRLTAELAQAGLGRGPSMACSHVGIELILDGQLLANGDTAAQVTSAFDAIAEARAELGDLVGDEKAESWDRHLGLLDERRLPRDYARPEAVAARLSRILASRPRLALPDHQIGIVAEHLAQHQPAIDASAEALIDELATTLAGPPTEE